MSLVATLAWTLAAVLGGLAAYAIVATVLLLYLDLPEAPSFPLAEDVAFAVTVPLVLAVAALRARRGEAGR